MKKRAFTLIELLVVIAIISILAAILFPVFANAREKGRSASCLNNTHQIGLAFLQYEQDYDETFPGLSCDLTTSSSYTHSFDWPYLVNPYIKSQNVFVCPDDPNVLANVLYGMPDCFQYVNGATCAQESYGMNASLQQHDGLNGLNISIGILISKINYVSETALICEDFNVRIPGQCYGNYGSGSGASFTAPTGQHGTSVVWYSGADTPTVSNAAGLAGQTFGTAFSAPIARHTGFANVTFCDGHSKPVAYLTLYSPPAGTTPANFRLWHPDAQ